MTNCTIFVGQTVECGARGICIAPGICACQPGYSQFGDFSVLPGNPCDIDVTAVRALWGINLIAITFAFSMSMWGIISRRMTNTAIWAAWRLWMVPYLVCGQSLLLFVIVVLKLIDPIVFIIAGDVAMTVLHAFCAFLSVLFLMFGLGGIARTSFQDSVKGKGGEDRAEIVSKMKQLEYLMVSFCLIALACAFIPCYALVDPEAAIWTAALHGAGFSIEMFILGSVVAPFQLGIMADRLSASLQRNSQTVQKNSARVQRMNLVLMKIKIVKKLAAVGFTFSAALVFAFAVWPYLAIKAAYTVPVMYVFAEIAAGSLIWVTTTNSSQLLRRPSMVLQRLSIAFSSSLRSSTEKPGGRGGKNAKLTLQVYTSAKENPVLRSPSTSQNKTDDGEPDSASTHRTNDGSGGSPAR